MNTLFEQYRQLPEQHAGNMVVTWHVCRTPDEATEFAAGIRLGDGQHMVGGRDRDSVGDLWWVGVEVDDLAHWGNHAAVNKHAG